MVYLDYFIIFKILLEEILGNEGSSSIPYKTYLNGFTNALYLIVKIIAVSFNKCIDKKDHVMKLRKSLI